MIKLGPRGDTASAVNEVSTSVLSERVRLVHEQLDDDQPLDCSIDTYGSPTHSSQPAVAIDWSANFADGFPAPHTWEQYLLPWLNEVINIVEQSTRGRPLRFRANAHLPAIFALGYCLQTTRGIETTWLQQNNGEITPWQVHTDEVESGLNSDLQMNNVSGSDLGVLVSVTNEVSSAVGRSGSVVPNLDAVLELSLGDDIGTSLTASEAAHAARVYHREVQRALNQLSGTPTIHLFMAGPDGLAFLFGQQSNTFAPVQTYIFSERNRTYQQAAEVGNR